MASATKRESVSFQRPLRSVTDAVSTRVTLVDAQPDVTTSAARNRLPSSARSFRIATILFLLQPVEGSLKSIASVAAFANVFPLFTCTVIVPSSEITSSIPTSCARPVPLSAK